MSTISEICADLADLTAQELAKVLEAALQTKNQEIINFCVDHVFPLYESEVADSFINRSPHLTLRYKEIQNGRNSAASSSGATD